MATIGQQLLTPEAGWKRCDDYNSNFSYIGTWGWSNTNTDHYNNTYHYSKSIGDKIQFNFTGTRLRILATRDSSTWVGGSWNVYIDGTKVGSYSNPRGVLTKCILLYEILGLEHKEHYVELVITNATGLVRGANFDAIDIDDTGELRPYSPFLEKIILQDSSNRIISRDVSGWVDTLQTIVNSPAFSSHGFSLGDISGLSKTDWQSLYTSFTPPFKFYVFKEEDAISQPKIKATYSQNDYTVARSYEVEISETDLQKVKSLSIV